jgi:hypothetical protein
MTPVINGTVGHHRVGPSPRLPHPLKTAWWAARALQREVLGFRFNYPLEIVPSADPRETLHYYIYSHQLFFDAMELGPQGIPFQRSRVFGEAYNPAYIAWYGLMSLERYLRGIDQAGQKKFLVQVDWLAAEGIRSVDGSMWWPYTFDWQEGNCFLKAPWISAMAQGLAISALVRAYRITHEHHLLDLSLAATKVFEKSIVEGGLRTSSKEGHVLYEEYPEYPLPRVLDGFLFSLLGLYDLAVETGNAQVYRLFAEGVQGLTHTLELWNYRDKWSWYGTHGYLCPPHYHKLNSLLVRILGEITSEKPLLELADHWDVEKRTWAEKLEIFLLFLVSKNWARLRLPRN